MGLTMNTVQSKELLTLIESSNEIRKTSFEVDEEPLQFFDPEDCIEFHATRLLLLIKYCSTNEVDEEKASIKGRTKLAKLDFFLRYPTYLEQALDKKPFSNEEINLHLESYERQNIEATMIRYKYGPWDKKYYDVFAYLLAKGLIEISSIGGVDNFLITEQGEVIVELLSLERTYVSLIERCVIIKDSLAQKSGSWLKRFIYRNFPQIVGQPMGSLIKGVYDA